MFVTVFMGMLNLGTGEFIYANGGTIRPSCAAAIRGNGSACRLRKAVCWA